MSEELEKDTVQTTEGQEEAVEETGEVEETSKTEKTEPNAEPEISQLQLENFQKNGKQPDNNKRIDLIMDIVLPVSIELGRTKMFVKDILELERGSIVELDKMAGEPVDLYINNKKMAEGEVVVVDKHFGIRITTLIDPQDRIKNLGKDF